MSKRFMHLGLMAVALVALVHGQSANLAKRNANVIRGENPLTAPSAKAPAEVVRDFLTANSKRARAAGTLLLKSEHHVERTGITHVFMSQKVQGLDVYGAYVKAAVNQEGQLVSVIENIQAGEMDFLKRATLEPGSALKAALAYHYGDQSPNVSLVSATKTSALFERGDFFYRAPKATKVAVPMADGSLEEGYLVETWDRDNMLYHTVVGKSGSVLDVQNRTNTDSYNIFPNHPGVTPQTVVSGPGSGNAQSPIGWVFNDTTTGNNVDAYLDRDANNSPDSGSRPVSATQDFLTSANLSQAPTTAANQDVAVQNLFYLCNVIHDVLYQHGFVEATGNFQEDNFGLGGQGGDSVNAEAQDGASLNNANFATPSDGSNPRMQMFLWNTTALGLDGDLDSDIVWHEYGHGLTWRMIGNMSGSMSGAIGEGMSDVLALLMNGDDVVGEYATNDPGGIRSAPYTNYSRTYGDFTAQSVHFDGEIYAATIWRLYEIWQDAGLSRNQLMDVLVDGMNFTPAGPAMEDMRDGILASASAAQDCLIWEAFAEFGIGVGAEARIRGGGARVTITESFDVPSSCDGGPGGDPITLTTNGFKQQGLQKADLTWSGATSANVDIYRNGNLIATVPNSGSYRDNIDQRGGGSYTHRVCESGGTTTCSNTTTTNF